MQSQIENPYKELQDLSNSLTVSITSKIKEEHQLESIEEETFIESLREINSSKDLEETSLHFHVSNLVLSFLDVGILFIPYNFKRLGIIPSIILFIITILLVLYPIYLLIKLAKYYHIKSSRIEDIYEKVFGSNKKIIFEIFIIFTICLAYISILNTTSEYFKKIVCHHNYCISRDYFILIAYIFNLFTILFSNLGKFGLLTFISLIVVGVSLGGITVFSVFKLFQESKEDIFKNFFDFHPKHIFSSFNVYVFSLFGIFMVIPIRKSFLKSKSGKNRNFFKFFSKIFFIVSLFYIIFTIPNFLYLGEKTEKIIFFNFNTNKILLVLGICYMAVIFIISPFFLFPIYEWSYSLNIIKNINPEKKKKLYFSKLFARFIILTVCILLSLLVDDVLTFMEFAAGFTIVLLGMLIPVLTYIYKMNSKFDLKTKIFYYFVGLFYFVIWVSSSVDSIGTLIKTHKINFFQK